MHKLILRIVNSSVITLEQSTGCRATVLMADAPKAGMGKLEVWRLSSRVLPLTIRSSQRFALSIRRNHLVDRIKLIASHASAKKISSISFSVLQPNSDSVLSG